MQVRFIIQARLQSKRLPAKSMKLIGDRALVGHILDRLNQLPFSEVSVAAALPEGNSDLLSNFFQSEGVDIYYGDETDVLSRFLLASQDLSDEDFVIRLTGDNPFIDHREAQNLIEFLHREKRVDLAYPYKLPLGMGFEAISVGALRSQAQNELLPHHREHVSVFIKENPGLYSIVSLESYSEHPQIRLTIDYEEDLKMARKCYEYFAGQNNPWFCSNDVYGLYQKEPGFFKDNLHMLQKSATSYEKG